MSLSDLAPGSRFDGHYVVEAVAGRGGMGVVYRAHDEELDRSVALKVAAERLADLPELQEGLRREARLAASVDHPSVVAVHHVGSVDGRPYVALQWIEGSDLRTRLQSGPPPLAEGLAILEQLASALDAAHAAGCLHRDVKPANVLVRDTAEGPRASLTDFGVAGALQDAGSHAGPGGAAALVGTPAYLAPELAQGAAGDERSDLYGLGCVAFELLTGTPPFTAATVPAMLVSHAVRPRPDASGRLAGLPGEVDPVLARAMAVDPDGRPASGAALMGELHRALGLGAGGRPAPGPRAAVRRLRIALDARPRVRRALIGGAVVATALLAGGAGAGAHELLTTPDASNEPAVREGRAPKKPNPQIFGGRLPAPVGPEARAEVAGLFQDIAVVNRTRDLRSFKVIGGPSGARYFGRDFRCRRNDDSSPPGYVPPKRDAKGVPVEDPVQTLQQYLWRTNRAPVRFEGLTAATVKPVDLGSSTGLQWRGTSIDGGGRRREVRMVASRESSQYPWHLIYYDYCPGLSKGG